MEHHPSAHFYGTATVGAKGQIVIPAKAREDLKIAPGDAMVVVGIKDRNMLGLCPVKNLESMIVELTAKLQTIRQAVAESEKEKKQ